MESPKTIRARAIESLGYKVWSAVRKGGATVNGSTSPRAIAEELLGCEAYSQAFAGYIHEIREADDRRWGLFVSAIVKAAR
jgi:hypothetical protein